MEQLNEKIKEILFNNALVELEEYTLDSYGEHWDYSESDEPYYVPNYTKHDKPILKIKTNFHENISNKESDQYKTIYKKRIDKLIEEIVNNLTKRDVFEVGELTEEELEYEYEKENNPNYNNTRDEYDWSSPIGDFPDDEDDEW